MHTLLVSREVPDANGGGSQRRAAQHLGMLRMMGDVTLVLPEREREYFELRREALAHYGLKAVIFRTDRTASAVSRSMHADAKGKITRFLRALQVAPFLDERPIADSESSCIGQLTDSYDLLFAFRLDSAVWADSIFRSGARRPAVSVIDFDDIESRSFLEIVVKGSEQSLMWRILLRRHLAWLRTMEKGIARRWTLAALCSALDADRFVEATGIRPAIVPNAIDIHALEPEVDGAGCNLLFVGTFGYVPNADGLRWFLDGIWPKLRAARGEAITIDVVGPKPPPDIVALDGTNGIAVRGRVEDLDPYYAGANIVVVPILKGSGTRIKAIEAAAHGRAIVTTTVGAEGIDFVPGEHAAFGDDADRFADAVLRLAGDPEARSAMAANGWRFVKERYAMSTVQRALLERIRSLFPASQGGAFTTPTTGSRDI